MTHAIWRGSVSFEIGGVSYVHGRNMFIADNGMSVAFTGEDKPTKRAVDEALGGSMVLKATLQGNQQDVGGFYDSGYGIYKKEIAYPIAPCYIVVTGRGTTGMLADKAMLSTVVAKNEDKEENVVFRDGVNLAGGEYREQWFNCDLWHDCNLMITSAGAIGDIYGVYIRFKAFSYTREYKMIEIE